MVLDSRLGAAVVAKDDRLGVLELGRHLLLLNLNVKVAEVRFHVNCTLVAYWTLV